MGDELRMRSNTEGEGVSWNGNWDAKQSAYKDD